MNQEWINILVTALGLVFIPTSVGIVTLITRVAEHKIKIDEHDKQIGTLSGELNETKLNVNNQGKALGVVLEKLNWIAQAIDDIKEKLERKN